MPKNTKLITLERAKEIIRFIIVGCMNVSVGYGLYLAFLWTGLVYYIAYGLAWVLALCFGFVMGGFFVFKNLKPSRIYLYFLTWGGLYLVNVTAIGVLISWGMAAEIAPLVVLPPNVIASYFVQKHIVFR